MSTGPRYRVDFQRKRSGKTDYRKRIKFLQSGRSRLVIRTSLNRVIAQIVNYSEKGDYVVISCDSKGLQDYGWKAGTSNIPAAYLTGLLIGQLAKENKVDNCILDSGRMKPLPGSKVFAALKGAIEGGLDIPHNDESLPQDDRIKGQHISDYASKLNKDNKLIFSKYKSNKLDPTNLPDHFELVKSNILKKTKKVKTVKTKEKKTTKAKKA